MSNLDRPAALTSLLSSYCRFSISLLITAYLAFCTEERRVMREHENLDDKSGVNTPPHVS